MSTVAFSTHRLIDRRSQWLRITPSALLFTCVMLFVGAVSVYDGYLVVRTGAEICQFEQNPVGLFLIHLNHGDPSLFLMVKAVGTLVVLAVMTVLYRRCQRIAFPVASAIMLFQTGLLIFLESA